ncbi:baseplate wedge protein [Synechococcus phage ACG-2014b]|uniref:Baseplate wedge protein n=2 Tax=Synechococcus phage ACG-2014b TaxID=1493508 RepID=A0A0E3EUL9_9CAUD|nr:baseplate wedge subunit [Synechococcus phage ACG-2014b]YP_009779714.1 baseplate wedge subunit [Synechococcus phage ACG-2014b]YP_009779928.1 baseplate wedge subunit [Synechococcus phage ACG-2014b]AIX17308.1 baseplate wedge protein [Synechococcus phage ACG-2014b]AIX17520.1 baseplate wedge protein [Synechococcus phage ACG-2014b]AIX17735.1 baseplate wedge protein [Synechococcus phage ACG-2014b]AIX17953.1 baseplate wedge protein [Synechococcus phage ACG-2014b]AIX18168.1 baseplate wedge protein
MQPNNLTALDFDDIKASIKSYLRTRTEFSDYDFEGSALSYLIDTLAYNSYYTAFNANMALNEAFLPSSSVRDNIVKLAKLLNYTPRSIICSKACLKLTIQTIDVNGFFPSSVTLPKGPVATGGNYIWNVIDDITTEVDTSTGIAEFDNLEVYEGSLIEFNYIVNTFANQRYIIQSQDADVSTLSVRVKPNETSTNSDLYSRVNNITDLNANTRAYFLSETDDMRYEVKFGDDSIGRSVKDGEVVSLRYMVTDGPDANGIQVFSFIGNIRDTNGQIYSPNVVDIVVKSKSVLGDNAESVESIKYYAPRYYSAQYRAVTAQDYEVITKNIYDNADAVVAFGGDSLNPPVYGKVYIVVKTKTGSDLNDQTKKSLSNQLRKYAMASIDPVIEDVDNIYINPKIFVNYDTGCGSNTSQIKSDISRSILDWGSQSKINNFNASFSTQSFERAIELSNSCITDVSTQLTLLRYIKPNTNQTNTYCISTGSPIYNSAPSSDDGDTNCKKEPVILSGPFRTADRPGVDQQFEDDGYGNLRTFYNTGNRKVYTNDSAGTVNYATGEICFGPVNIIGSGGSNADDADISITDSSTGLGSVVNPENLPSGLQLPVQVIPSNSAVLPATTPGTIINIISPEISVTPIGTQFPSSIPLNSLTPGAFNVSPVVLDIPTIDNSGSLNTSSCFT